MFTIGGDVIMMNYSGKKIFLRHFGYISPKLKKELLADNHQTLIASIPEAAEQCAENVVAYLKSDLGVGGQTFTTRPSAQPATPTPPAHNRVTPND